jgi:ABC-type glycerol-3-phosphate transport system substrate-binding protein
MSQKSRPSFISRRNFLKGTLAGSMAIAWTPALRALAADQAQRNRARLAKQGDNVLRILAINWPQGAVEQQLADEVFTPETGIEVVLEVSPYQFTEQRLYQLIGTGNSEFDIYHYDSQWLGSLVVAGGLEQLDTDTYLNSGSAAIAFDDFFPSVTERLGRYNGNVYGFPWSLNCQILWYRSDLISSPPDTWDQVREVARDVTSGETYGWVWQGNRTSDWIMVDYCPLFWSLGGELWDEANWIADGFVNSDIGVQAVEFMRAMVDPAQDASVDPATANWTIGERGQAYAQGRVAMGLNWAPLGGTQDNMGYALSPAGPDGQRYHMFGCQGTGINALSSKKEQAWQYLQWLLSRDTQEALTTDPAAVFFSGRIDLQDVSAAQSPVHAAFAEAVPTIKDFWNNASYLQLLLALAGELNTAYVGRKGAKEALDDAAIAHQLIYDSSPENPANM